MIETQKRTINIGLMTNYLTRSFEEWSKKFSDEMQFQIETAKLEKENLAGVRYMNTPAFDVRLHSPNEYDVAPGACSLIIAGNTEPNEFWSQSLMGSGILIGRFSIFYGGNSRYTGNSAAQGGYALDIPKSVDTVKAMLQHEPLLEGLLMRDAQLIENGLGSLNSKLSEPVIATPYLSQALQIRR